MTARHKRSAASTSPKPPLPEFSDLRLRGKTVKRLRFFSTMDNESYDTIITKLMDHADGRRRRSTFEAKEDLREYSEEYRELLT